MRALVLISAVVGLGICAADLSAQPQPRGSAGGQDSTLHVGEIRLRYRTEGRGPTVVLIHGFAGRLEAMSDLAAAVTPGFRVTRLDLRGFGESSHPRDPALYGLNVADDIIALLDRLGETRAHLVGYSLGAAVAAKVAARHPHRVATVVLVGGAGLTDSSLMMRISADAAAALEQGRGLRPFFVALTPPGRPVPSDSAMAAVSREVLATGDSLAWAALLRSQHGLALSADETQALRMPVLVIGGTDDPLGAEARLWERTLPNARFVAIDGAAHDDLLARREVSRELRAFLLRWRRQ